MHEFSDDDPLLISVLIAGLFSLLTVGATAVLVTTHLANWTRPLVQRKIFVFLLMPVVYCVTTAAALVLPWMQWPTIIASFLHLIRDLYESTVMYTFQTFVLELILTEEHTFTELAQAVHRRPPPVVLPDPRLDERDALMTQAAAVGVPTLLLDASETAVRESVISSDRLSKLRYWLSVKGKPSSFLFSNRRLLLQYPLTAVVTVLVMPLLVFGGVADPSSLSFTMKETALPNIAAYLAIVQFLSSLFAVGALVDLYAFGHDHPACQAHSLGLKFLSLKAVLVLTFWQSLALAGIPYLQRKIRVGNGEMDTAPTLGEVLQSVLVCVEMLCVAVLHSRAFSAEPFQQLQPLESEPAAGRGGVAGALVTPLAHMPQLFRPMATELFAPPTHVRSTAGGDPRYEYSQLARDENPSVVSGAPTVIVTGQRWLDQAPTQPA